LFLRSGGGILIDNFSLENPANSSPKATIEVGRKSLYLDLKGLSPQQPISKKVHD
jgi:hypothetical protein